MNFVDGFHILKQGKYTLALAVLVAAVTLAGLTGILNPASRPEPRAVRGVIDLDGWDFGRNGSLPLQGDWAFYWEQFLSPRDFTSEKAITGNSFLPVPTPGLKHPRPSAKGFATYRLILENVPAGQRLALRIDSLMEACTVWVNGRKAYENGVVGRYKASQKAGRPASALIRLTAEDDKTPVAEIVVQVSKYRYISGGTKLAFFLGPEKNLAGQLDRARLFAVFSSALLLAMGCYHLVFYFFRPQDRSLLFFSLYCLLWMTVLLINASHQTAIPLISEVPLRLLVPVDQAAYFFTIPFVFLFMKAMFPAQTPSLLVRLYLVSAACLSVWFIFADTTETRVIITGHIISATSILFFFTIAVRAALSGHQTARMILSGGVVLWLCGVNDILNALEIIQTGVWIHSGLVIFIFSQAISLAFRFAKTFRLAQDLSVELREKNKALTRLDSLKDEFIANTTHELSTPLSGIIGIAESMTAGAAGDLPPKAVRNLDMIAVSGKRLNNLLEDILDLSRLKNKDLNLKLQPVDPAGPADLTIRLLTPLAEAKGLCLSNNISPGTGLVLADENRLQQIFHNLVGNAIKYTEKGDVSVRANVVPPHMEIAVSDTGIGIPENKREDIFRYFEQVRSEASKASEGTGLGLPISKQLIELHNGAIRVESTVNQGTTFFFTLPLADETSVLPRELPHQPHPLARAAVISGMSSSPHPSRYSVPGNAPEILVVDDDPINLQVVVNHLEMEHMIVHTAGNGESALKMVREAIKPDLVLLDIMMPGIDGYAVCRKLRKTHSLSAMPVVMLTAKKQLKDLVNGFDAGANDYLTKPFSREELLARVNTQLKLGHAFRILEENEALKQEIRRRKKTELDLQLIQHRLERILDSLDDAVIAVNESLEICFSNAACRRLLGYNTRELLGLPVANLFSGNPEKAGEYMTDLIRHDKRATVETHMLRKDAGMISCRLAITALDLEEETLKVMMLQSTDPTPAAGPAVPAGQDAISIVETVNKNRERIELLEKVLVGDAAPAPQAPIRDSLEKIQEIILRMEQSWTPASNELEKRAVAVQAMNLALSYWQDATGMTKVDLAEQSGIWKVYMDKNGFQRTQTLDKYLDSEKFPKNPRWNQIFKTIDFVLLSCKTQTSSRKGLESAFSSLKQIA